jgi:hypothetical protein
MQQIITKKIIFVSKILKLENECMLIGEPLNDAMLYGLMEMVCRQEF